MLVVTEGLLVYLDDDEVRILGRELAAQPRVRWWITDVTSPAIRRMLSKGMGAHLDNAPMKFAPSEGVAFFESLGWSATEIRSMYREAVRFRRAPPLLRIFALLPEPGPRKPRHNPWSAVVRFTSS